MQIMVVSRKDQVHQFCLGSIRGTYSEDRLLNSPIAWIHPPMTSSEFGNLSSLSPEFSRILITSQGAARHFPRTPLWSARRSSRIPAASAEPIRNNTAGSWNRKELA